MKLLLIVSRDFGELGNALYFLDGQVLDAPPVIMLPASFGDPGIGALSAQLRHYADLDDIIAALDTDRPDAVLLFSGYLLQVGARLSLLNSLRLLRLLKRRRIPVLTSDPFLGAIRHPWSLDFYVPIRAVRRAGGVLQLARARVEATLLGLRLYLLSRSLRAAWHGYPARVQRSGLPAQVRWSGYFNDKAQACQPSAAAAQDQASWVFILSQIDGDILMEAEGQAFIDALCARLDDTLKAGRRAVLIASQRVLAALPPHWHARAGVELRTQCAYDEYMQVVMSAQYAFFWNYFSFSIIHRVIARRPVFFFGAGHMVRILPLLARQGIDNLYAGETPALLPMQSALDADALAQQASAVSAQFERVVAGLRSLPAPLDLLRTMEREA